jgi:hypothetical protein
VIARDRQAAVLHALVGALNSDAQLTALVGHRIYDAAPGRLAPPALALRLVGGADASSADSEAQRLTFDVDVWDHYHLATDLDQSRILMDHVRRILHLQPLGASDCGVVLVRCTASQGPFRDPDGLTVHAVVTVGVLAGHEAAG